MNPNSKLFLCLEVYDDKGQLKCFTKIVHSCLTYMLARSTKWREFQFFKQLMDCCRLDPRARMEKKSGSGIRDKHPGSATLFKNKRFAQIKNINIVRQSLQAVWYYERELVKLL